MADAGFTLTDLASPLNSARHFEPVSRNGHLDVGRGVHQIKNKRSLLLALAKEEHEEAEQIGSELDIFDANLRGYQVARPRLQTSARRGVSWQQPPPLNSVMRVPTSEVRPGDRPFKPAPRNPSPLRTPREA